MTTDPYQIVPSLWIGSEEDDLIRERRKLMSSLVEGDQSVKTRIKEITDRLIYLRTGKKYK